MHFQYKVSGDTTEINVTWLIDAILMGLEDKIAILQAHKYQQQDWVRKALELIIQTAPRDLEKII